MTKNRLIEIKKRLEELDELRGPLWDEQFKLEAERTKIYTSIAKEIALGLSWELHYDKDSAWYKIRLECSDYDERHIVNEKLFKNADGDYHKTYEIIEGELHGRASLSMSDGDLSLNFSTVDDFKKYSKEWNLKIDVSKLAEKLVELKYDIEMLKEILGADAR